MEQYIVQSLELHLFFGRIMKEHAFFLRAGFTPAAAAFSREAEAYRREFEALLARVVRLGDGLVSEEVLASGEVVTEFTRMAERQTERFVGIPIDEALTERTLRLRSGYMDCGCNRALYGQVRQINRRALELLDGLIAFKETILRKVLTCELFTMNYPLLIEHILREARLYREYVCRLEEEGMLPCASMKEVECFWNRIMMEHAMFIRGLLDPSEEELFDAADGFAKEYSVLLETCCKAQDRSMEGKSLEETKRFREFKTAGTKGIEQCKIRSVILPLLADHVLREANHYIRLLEYDK